MRLNRKGFTLIELLGVIVILALVLGFSTYGIISAVNNSKEKKITLSENSIREAARTYSNEVSSDLWKETSDYDMFCVTIGELINKGLLDDNATIEGKYEKNNYVLITRNKITLAIEKEEILTNTNEEICTGENGINGEEIVSPEIGGSTSYTNKIVVEFTPGNAKYNGENSDTTYECLYGESSSTINRKGKIEGNTCVLDNLKNNHNYYVIIYMNTEHGSSKKAEGDIEYKTSDFNSPDVKQNKNVITVSYNDTDSNGNPINIPGHYFMSNVKGETDKKIAKCILNNGIFYCSGESTTVDANIWYKVDDINVSITYPEEDNNIVVAARINDESNNYKETERNFVIEKHTVKFYRNNALNIDGSIDDYIEKYCITSGGGECEIISPSITVSVGYDVVGWNTNSGVTTSDWSINTSKVVNSDLTYYAILKAHVLDIKFNVNEGNILSSTNGGTYTWTTDSDGLIYRNGNNIIHSLNYGDSLPSSGISDYNDLNYMYITKTGYTVNDGAEWKCLSGCTNDGKIFSQSTIYSTFDFCDLSNSDCSVVLGVNWTLETYIVDYDANGGSEAPTQQTKTYGNDLTLTSDTPTRTGYRFLGWSTSKDATSATYAAGGTYSVNASATLYAVWQAPYGQAIYSADDNSLRFYYTSDLITVGDIYNGKTVTAVYDDFETTNYSLVKTVPWYEYRENIEIVSVEDSLAPTSTAFWFYEFMNCSEINLANLNTSNVTTMISMFSKAGYNTLTFTLSGLDNWDTSNVKNMSNMFSNVGNNATEWSIGDLSNFNTSSVTSMYAMFYQAGYNASEWSVGNLSDWDTSSVTSMHSMFYQAGYKASEWSIGNLNDWDTSSVTSMGFMFAYAGRNTTEWSIGDLSNWDTSSVTDMNAMFHNAGYSATEWSVGDLSNWNTSNVTDMGYMFSFAGKNATKWSIGDLSKFNTSSVTSMKNMFEYAGYSATEWSIGNLNNWDTSSVTNMDYMFYQTGYSVSEWSIGELNNWDTSNVTSMHSMFNQAGYSASEWSIGELNNWDTSSVTSMMNMFYQAGYSATEWSIGKLNNWDTSSVTSMGIMFAYAGYSATEWNIGDLSNWDTSSVTDMNAMFHNAGYSSTNEWTLDLSTKEVTKSDESTYTAWDVSGVTNYIDFSGGNGKGTITIPTWVN